MLPRAVPTSTGTGFGRVATAAALMTLMTLISLAALSACGQKGALVLAKPLPPAPAASAPVLAR